MTELRIASAQEDDLGRYIDLLEEVADWLEARGIRQWRPGSFRLSSDYYAESIGRREVHLAFIGDELVGAFRVLMGEPIVWPDVAEDDAVYVHTLAVRRSWGKHRFGGQMLKWAADRATHLGREFVRLDCVADNQFLVNYYLQAGFEERGEIDARFPPPVGTLRLRRYERSVRTQPMAAQHRMQPAAADAIVSRRG